MSTTVLLDQLEAAIHIKAHAMEETIRPDPQKRRFLKMLDKLEAGG
jgi:hypothetical protein